MALRVALSATRTRELQTNRHKYGKGSDSVSSSVRAIL